MKPGEWVRNTPDGATGSVPVPVTSDLEMVLFSYETTLLEGEPVSISQF